MGCLGGVCDAQTAELRSIPTGIQDWWGGLGFILVACRPFFSVAGRAHCLRFAHPAKATWRPEVQRRRNAGDRTATRRTQQWLQALGSSNGAVSVLVDIVNLFTLTTL